MINKIKLLFSGWQTVTFYMKSGNKIVCRGVLKTFSIKYTGNTITQLYGWCQVPWARDKLFLSAFNLDQIEAIVLS